MSQSFKFILWSGVPQSSLLSPLSLCRFLFILLGPLGKGPQYHEIGRSIATLMTDEVSTMDNTVFISILYDILYVGGSFVC